jgi:hypothetical protein
MRHARGGVWIATVGAALIGLAGCGSGGGGSAGPATTASVFAGHWAGSWSDGEGNTGTMDVTVGTDGKLTGGIVNDLTGEAATASGQVSGTGQLNATYSYPRSGPVVARGTVAMATAGSLTGDVQEIVQGQYLSTAVLRLTRQ